MKLIDKVQAKLWKEMIEEEVAYLKSELEDDCVLSMGEEGRLASAMLQLKEVGNDIDAFLNGETSGVVIEDEDIIEFLNDNN